MSEYNYAGFWIRLAAALIDSVLLSILVGVPLTMIYGTDYWTSEELIAGFWDAVFYVVPVVITIWFWVKYLGTPGKMLLRVRVIDANTGRTQLICRKSEIVKKSGYSFGVRINIILHSFQALALRRIGQGPSGKVGHDIPLRQAAHGHAPIRQPRF